VSFDNFIRVTCISYIDLVENFKFAFNISERQVTRIKLSKLTTNSKILNTS